MDISKPGHKYYLDSGIISEGSSGYGAFPLVFMERFEDGSMDDGTTNEEVLEALIDRIQWLQKKVPCRENEIVITKLEESLMWLKKRTQDRLNRGVEGTNIQ